MTFSATYGPGADIMPEEGRKAELLTPFENRYILVKGFVPFSIDNRYERLATGSYRRDLPPLI